MAYIPLTTRAAGYTITAAADWNPMVGDMVAVRSTLGIATRGANQSINDSSFTAISLDTSYEDNDTYFNIGGTPTRITFPRAGHYLLEVEVYFSPNATGYRAIEIRQDGGASSSSFAINSVGAGYSTIARASFLTASMIATHYLEVYAWQNSGSPMNILARVSVNMVKDES
jgi:hypothetical protein